jgi:alpha-mannosidase
MGKSIDFFEKLSTHGEKLPNFKGELYLEKHQGTLTSQGKNKYYNRLLERLLHEIEFLSTVATAAGYKLNQSEIDEIWKEVLLYQFHDIIPGSSINRVYVESVLKYKEMESTLRNRILEILDFLGKDDGLTAINAAPYPRDEYFKHNGKWYKTDVAPYSSAKPVEVSGDFPELSCDRNTMTNGILKLKFEDVGHLSSIFDIKNNRETIKGYGNRLVVYSDPKMHFNAWDISINYPNLVKNYFDACEAKTYIDGATVVRETKYKFRKSRVTQKVILTAGSPLVVFETEVDWKETHKMLRADFLANIKSDVAAFDIQFGHIFRSTKTDNKKDWAQFEVCNHKWSDLSDEEYGISLLNNCKYGIRIKNGLMSLNLLRSPTYPDKTCDKGIHNFSYAIYPHVGSLVNSDTQKHGYLFNNPLILSDKNITISPLATTDKNNIIIETIKLPNVLRIYENKGVETAAKITTNITHKKAFECDMLENKISETDLSNLNFKPFEIKTIKLV